MNETVSDLIITAWNNLAFGWQTGEITWLNGMLCLSLAGVLSVVGGAIGGMILGGKDISYRLAAKIGGLLGPTGVLPATFVGLIILKLLR